MRDAGTRGIAAAVGRLRLAEEELGEVTIEPAFDLWTPRVGLVLDNEGVRPIAWCRLGCRFSLPPSSGLRFLLGLWEFVAFAPVAERGGFLATVWTAPGTEAEGSMGARRGDGGTDA